MTTSTSEVIYHPPSIININSYSFYLLAVFVNNGSSIWMLDLASKLIELLDDWWSIELSCIPCERLTTTRLKITTVIVSSTNHRWTSSHVFNNPTTVWTETTMFHFVSFISHRCTISTAQLFVSFSIFRLLSFIFSKYVCISSIYSYTLWQVPTALFEYKKAKGEEE